MNNLKMWLEKATPELWDAGIAWYPYARWKIGQLAERYNVEHKRLVWCVAALSPQQKWETNIQAAEKVLQGHDRIPGVYSANIEKALHVMYDPEPHNFMWVAGNKTTRFARNLWGDASCVTIDTWAWRAWAGVSLWAKPPSLDKLYDQIEYDYLALANEVGLLGYQVQAIIWVIIRALAYGRVPESQKLMF